MATATEANHQQAEVEKVVSTSDRDSVAPGIVQKLDEKILKHSHDADAAMKAFEGMDGQVIELTPEKNKALLRKIDWHLMPVSSSMPQEFSNADTCRSCASYMDSIIWIKLPLVTPVSWVCDYHRRATNLPQVST